ncbi:glycosyltransferase family 2 protein [Pseudotamlana agarivorans]|uniref:glycosyltransferase family 2 protein n=1 Tax=Pseudotamlana agarivorans TaxID=481183 RepID=UPI000834AABD|nr:glycosyltransferase family 2 protein [Tamlana agarivorans]
MLLSIIIPVYNAEKFIERCVDSILKQANDLNNNLEILIINDGSKDGSLELIKKLEILHPVIKVLNQKNSGVGHTRNVGLSKSQGQYIWFIDADDFIDGSILKNIKKALIDHSPEVVLLGYKSVNFEGEILSEVRYENRSFNRDEIIENHLYTNTVWSKVINRHIINTHNLQFNNNVSTAEDFDFSFRLLYYIKKVMTLSGTNYNYVINPNSISNIRSTKHLEKLATDSATIAQGLKDFLDSNESKYEGSRALFSHWLNNYLYGLLFSLFRFKYNISFIKKILEDLKKSNNYPINKAGMSLKKKFFVSISNNKALFLMACKFNRSINIKNS